VQFNKWVTAVPVLIPSSDSESDFESIINNIVNIRHIDNIIDRVRSCIDRNIYRFPENWKPFHQYSVYTA